MTVDDKDSFNDEEAATELTSVRPEQSPSAQDGAQPEISSKKKKKKKKKKAAPEDSQAPQETAAANSEAVPKADKRANDKRFSSAIAALASDEEDSMWVALQACSIFESKMKRLAEALQNNTQVTSLDLSDNQIGEQGAEALLTALRDGAAPGLISLNLRGNQLSDAATSSLAEIQTSRRQLKVELDGHPDDESLVLSSTAPGANGNAREPHSTKTTKVGAWDALPDSQLEALPNGVETDRVKVETAEEDPAAAASRLWSEVEQALGDETCSVGALSRPLWEIREGLSKELEASMIPFPPKLRLADFRPFTRACVESLQLLGRVLGVPAREVLQPAPPCCRLQSTPVEARQVGRGVGSHRVAAAALVQNLMTAQSSGVNAHIVKADVLPRVIGLAAAHPACNALHAPAAGIIRLAVGSSLSLLWQSALRLPLTEPQADSNGNGSSRGDSWHSDGLSLPGHLARVGTAAALARNPSSRSCDAGFAVQVATVLLEALDSNAALAQSLKADPGWMAFVAKNGAFEGLQREQSGDLCGPRPDRRYAFASQNGLAPSSWGQSYGQQSPAQDFISGSDLIKLLANRAGA